MRYVILVFVNSVVEELKYVIKAFGANVNTESAELKIRITTLMTIRLENSEMWMSLKLKKIKLSFKFYQLK